MTTFTSLFAGPLNKIFFVIADAVSVVKRHVQSLRTRYGKDKREYLSPPSGSAAKEAPEEEKVFMKRMGFLYTHIVPRATQNTLVRITIVS